MVKLDLQNDNQTRGRFTRLVVYLNLNRPLISQVLVDEVAQRVEYEALPIVCFACGKYGHVKEMCNLVVSSQNLTNLANKADKTSDKPTAVMGSIPMDSMDHGWGKSIFSSRENGLNFGLLVEKKFSRRGKRDSTTGISAKQDKFPSSSKFLALLEGKI